MKTRVLFITTLMFCFGHSALAGSLTGTGTVESYQLAKAQYNGSKARNYKVYVPRSYDRTQAVPMVFALHGCKMDHQDAINNWNWDLVADAHNLIVVFPFVTQYDELRNQNCWGYWLPAHIHEGAGEVEDLHRMALEVESNYTIDPERRYIIGLSSGGGMAVAAAIAYSEYWAAGASAAGLPYGDWSNSVLAEIFKSLPEHISAIEAELDDQRVIPFMAINSINDETVRLKAAELIRDSHIAVFDGDINSASASDCSAEGIACTQTRYQNDEAKTVVETVFYDGAVAGTQCGPLGCGHYYGGEDDDPEAWAYGTGPSTTQIAWEFFSRHTFSGNIKPEITAQSNVTDGNKIHMSGSATDGDGTVVSVLVIVKKRVGTVYQDFMELPVSGDFSAFSMTTEPIEDGIYQVHAVAMDNDNAKTQSTPEIQLINVTAHPPVVTDLEATVVQNSVTISGSVTDADNDLDRLQVTVEDRTKAAAVDNSAFTVRFDQLDAGNHSAEATAYDSLEQTGSAAIGFTIEYIPPPSATATIQKHCEAGRIPWAQYSSYFLKYGFNEFTVYQKPDGTWDDQPPSGTCMTAAVSEHVGRGRAYAQTVGWWLWAQTTYYAKGSNDELGDDTGSVVSLQKSGTDHWERVEACP